jgi:hypothetical protein
VEAPKYAASHPPRCLIAFRAVPMPPPEPRFVRYGLESRSGATTGSLLGYPLDPDDVEEPLFASPLSIHWTSEASANPMLDTAIHGYNGEQGWGSAVRGEGAQLAWSCVACHSSTFRMSANFGYWDAVDDLWDDEPALPIQDYFTSFFLVATCASCGREQRPSVIDT